MADTSPERAIAPDYLTGFDHLPNGQTSSPGPNTVLRIRSRADSPPDSELSTRTPDTLIVMNLRPDRSFSLRDIAPYLRD